MADIDKSTQSDDHNPDQTQVINTIIKSPWLKSYRRPVSIAKNVIKN